MVFNKKTLFISLTLLLIIVFGYRLIAFNWHIWRGTTQTSISVETGIDLNAPFQGSVWEKNVGEGFSTVSVYENYLLTAGHTDGMDTIFCLEPKTGKVIWKYSYPEETGRRYTGTLATPVTDGEKVYHFSRRGRLLCLELKTGKIIWQVSTVDEYGANTLMWGMPSTPVIVDNMVIVNAGAAGMAFNRKTGEPVWSNQGGTGNYSTAKPFVYNDKKYIALMSRVNFLILDQKTGDIVASTPWQTRHNIVGSDAVVNRDGSHIFISSAYNKGGAVYKFDGNSLTQKWENGNLGSHFTTSILIEGEEIGTGTLYGVNGNAGQGRFTSVDFKTGELNFLSNLRFGSFIMADNLFIYNTERGDLVFIEPNPYEYREVASGRIIHDTGRLWNIPVISQGYLYCKSSTGNIVCLKISSN